MNKYDKILKLAIPIKKMDIEFVNDISRQYPNYKILIEIKNTRGLSSKLLENLNENIDIRVEGGYDQTRRKAFKNVIFSDGEDSSYYYEAVIYSRNELINILREIEKIENGINNSWIDLKKVIYIYQKIKSDIMYDPKFEIQPSRDIRSLRGLISKQTVCAGYSLILKELLDRQKIICHYVEGKTNTGGTHAWNIIKINNRYYGIDVTWDNFQYRKGDFYSFKNLGINKEEFCDTHFPFEFEVIQNYDETLNQFDSKLLSSLYSELLLNKEFNSTIYTIKREDGSTCYICHIGRIVSDDGVEYNKYFYMDSEKSDPKILYTEFNMTEFMYSKIHNIGKKYTNEMYHAIANKLFSKDNIATALQNSNYIGRIFDEKGNFLNKVEKNKKTSKKLYFKTKPIIRSDKSEILLEEEQAFNFNGKKIYSFYVHELIKDANNYTIKSNHIFSDKNLLIDDRSEISNKLLSRENIDSACKYYIGYMGYCNLKGDIILNPEILSRIQIFNKKDTDNEYAMLHMIPYSEVLYNISNYDINLNKKKIINIKKNYEVTDPKKISDIKFSKFWQECIKTTMDKNISFNEMQEFYNDIFIKIIESIKRRGFIDTMNIYEYYCNSKYTFAPQIIISLFKSKIRLDFLYEYFTGEIPSIEQKELYNLDVNIAIK